MADEVNIQNTFLAILKQFPILLNKSQIPTIKEEKVNALQTTCIKLEEILGRKFTPQQVQKKIQNMKTELKRKTDRKATGNQKTRLKRWEEEFLQLLDGKSNPTIGRIPGKWKNIIDLFKSEKQGDSNDVQLLWVRPSEENLNFIKENVLNAGCSHLISIGCGSGLLEWLIHAATGLQISGIEVDRNWWESPYAPQTFIALLYADEETFSYSMFNNGNSALMFCYFNNGEAFSEYMRHYTGNCLIVIGPGEGRGTHTCPAPFDIKFDGIDQWRLSSLQELQKTRDFIAVYLKAI